MPTSRRAGLGDGLSIKVVDDSAGDALADLWEWLHSDAPQVRLEPVRRPVRPGELSGGVLAALETAVLSKESLGMVATGIGVWLSVRATTRRTRIRVKCGEVEVEIDTADVARADEIARRLSRELGGG